MICISMKDEEHRAELIHFLRSRRECFKPSQFSLPEEAKQRRTPGLRREELAQDRGHQPFNSKIYRIESF